MSVRLRYFAAARDAAGVREEDLPAGVPLRVVLAQALLAHPGLERILPACSYLMDGTTCRPETLIRDGAVVDVLPPFAGG